MEKEQSIQMTTDDLAEAISWWALEKGLIKLESTDSSIEVDYEIEPGNNKITAFFKVM